eukprot:scaffold2026_cov176-Amphora_coffeaeformis.AAC.7
MMLRLLMWLRNDVVVVGRGGRVLRASAKVKIEPALASFVGPKLLLQERSSKKASRNDLEPLTDTDIY